MTEPRLVMAERQDHPSHSPEAEPVLVDDDGKVITLTLDDGETLRFDRSELLGEAA